ncbi:MAG: hypothetical protein ACR2OZ_20525 [Verrucomicrobiales bacterium]
MDSVEQLRASLFRTAQHQDFCEPLKSASLAGDLASWTTILTRCLVAACREIGWRASAKGHECELLPVRRSEYLALDVTAFPAGEARWLFPVAVMELENSPREDQIAYSLWKVLCVRADVRAVFCYRREATRIPALIQFLRREVVEAMSLPGRLGLGGRTLLVCGSRADAETFPFGFFKWWELDSNTGRFEGIQG